MDSHRPPQNKLRHSLQKQSQVLLRKGLAALPETLRQRAYRRCFQLNYNPPPHLKLKLAETQEELEAAFRVLNDCYIEQGFGQTQPSGIRVTLHHALPSTCTLIALWNSEVVGTVSIVKHNKFGLPMEKSFDLGRLRSNGRRVAEITCLSVRNDHRRVGGGDIYFPLIKFLYTYCVRCFGVDLMAVVLHPKHQDFYADLLGFEKIEEKVVPDYLGAPAVGMFLDLEKAYERNAMIYADKPAERNLFRYIVNFEAPNFAYPCRDYFKISEPVMTPELLDYFFNRKTDIFSRLTDRDYQILLEDLGNDVVREIVPQRLSPLN